MNRKLDWPTLLLFTALLFGAVVRFWPVITNGFPLNDGGMFYTMIRDLKANHFILPQFTSYNFANIPFAYPLRRSGGQRSGGRRAAPPW